MSLHDEQIDALFEQVTKDWTDADWEMQSVDDLRYHISEFLHEYYEGKWIEDRFLAAYEFEQYMGW